MVWSRDSLSDDVMGYILYWAPTDTSALEPYAVFDFASDTNYVFNESPDEGTIAGCFAVTALDSLLVGPNGELRRNESEFSNVVCVDNCPFYFLPNIFTPNGDFSNDLFQPFPWKFVQSVEFVVHNRWGKKYLERKTLILIGMEFILKQERFYQMECTFIPQQFIQLD